MASAAEAEPQPPAAASPPAVAAAAAAAASASGAPALVPAPLVPAPAAAPLAGFPTWQLPAASVATPCCPHYARNCHLRAPCCNALVACRRCHDALVPDGHPMDRRHVKAVKCLGCDREDQPLSEECIHCKTRFAAYFCRPCAMYDDTPGRDIFHCDGCGVCRLGRRADYVHCEGCRACLPTGQVEGHVCAGRALCRPCPVCQVDMHESVRRCTIPRCGHAMHQGCFEHYVKTSYACTTCGKSLADMSRYWEVLDKLVARDLVGKSNKLPIRCRDCGKVSSARAHPEFHKCGEPDCGSYNTTTKVEGPTAT